MEDAMIVKTNLGDLKQRASKLAAAAESLAALFAQEANHLKRREEVARLEAVRSVILERLRRERELETAAQTGHHMGRAVVSVVRLVGGLVTMAFQDEMTQAISRSLLEAPRDKEIPFGTVLVRVGPGGVPEDVEVVNISEMARESGGDERAIIDELMAQGNLLYAQEAFTGVIDRLADRILKGELSLPVSPHGLHQLQERRPLRLGPGNEAG